jgi:hypothetical protein
MDSDRWDELEALSAHEGLFSQQLNCHIQFIKVVVSLLLTPFVEGVQPDIQ